MRPLAKKIRNFGILTLEFILGTIVMAAAMIVLPVGILMIDVSLILNPYVLGVVIIGMLMFGMVAYFLFMRPYLIYRKSPDVLAEADGEYLYIYGKKQVKIPLSALADAVITFQLPFIYSNEFVAVLLVHLFSEKYGDLILDVPEYGSYKMRFVSNVQETSREFIAYLSAAQLTVDC